MPKPFHDARLKIERAEHHINDLHRRMLEFIDEKDAYSVYAEQDPEASGDSINVVATKAIPKDFPLIIGDAIHNLRTALDFTMHDIVFTPTEYTRFPIRDTANDVKAAVNGGLKQNAAEHVLNFIVDVVQPYKGGDGDAIWCLHELDIEDKHRLIIPHMQLTAVNGICVEDDGGVKYQVPTWMIANKRTASHTWTGHRNIKITNKGEAALGILFGQGFPRQGELILPTLREFAKFVSGTIDGIETVFLA
jgi:hypothetical protein